MREHDPTHKFRFACLFCQKDALSTVNDEEEHQTVALYSIQPFIRFIFVSYQVSLPHKDNEACCVAKSLFEHRNRCLYRHENDNITITNRITQ